ncbi:MAG: protein kinase [Polyangiaceae bacterium]|nr:protein kinase [Polyangiaceae bacterium]
MAELGSGGMAHVYLALARGPSGFAKLSVIKVLKQGQLFVDEPDALTMFMNEARLAARLNHPHVVQTNEVGEDRGRHYIVMEYLEGQPLDRIMKRTRDDAGRAQVLPCLVRALCDALSGLHYAHELADYDGTPLDIVHRDVSPKNIFVTYDGLAKVVDFGIAKARHSSGVTQAGSFKGTVRYMAPEQVRAKKVDRRADVFAAGVILWEITSGQRMWRGLEDINILHRLLAGEIPPPEGGAFAEYPTLALVCQRALAIDPEQRYPSAQHMRIELENALGSIASNATGLELGALTSRLFGDERHQLRRLVDQHLAETSVPASIPPPEGTFGTARLTAFSNQETASPAVATALEPPRPSFLRRAALPSSVLLFVLAVGGGAWALKRSSLPDLPTTHATPLAASQSAAPPAPEPEAVPENVELRVSTSPVDARVYLDGRPLGDSPLRLTLPRGGEHELRLEAPGHQTLSRRLSFERDVMVEFMLTPAPRPIGGGRHQPQRQPPRPVPSPAVTDRPFDPNAPPRRPPPPPIDTAVPYQGE